VDQLQPLPAGYPDSSTFLNEMNRKQNEWNKINNDIADINIAITKLEKDLEAVGYEATELQEIERKTRMEFARVKEKAEALEAVREAALPLLATANDPFLTLQPRIVGHVKELTADRYTEVKMKDNLPTAMVRDGMELRPRQLSGGTGGVLALALRLALADLYLEDRKGFLMMDDPFTEMDEDRHALAANALVRMGEQKQMIFFTCHKQHAKLFPAQLRIERKS
jgi:exonuclease SbcC